MSFVLGHLPLCKRNQKGLKAEKRKGVSWIVRDPISVEYIHKIVIAKMRFLEGTQFSNCTLTLQESFVQF